MAFMMPVVKNDWDIYNTRRSRHSSESAELAPGRVRKVSESRSEGPGPGAGVAARAGLSPHRSAPTMRSLSYSRSVGPSRAPARAPEPPRRPASPQPSRDKFHTRLVDKLRRALGRSDERTS